MKNCKKYILILACLTAAIVLLYFINDTYAKYLTSASGDANIPIARWNIKVNNNSIKNNEDISASLSPVFPGNDNIASNIIAPTAEGYFDLDFDFTAADVSFSYEITIESDENSAVSDLVAVGYSVDDGPFVMFDADNHTITDTIAYTSNIDTRNIRVYIVWDDTTDSAIMDNNADTVATQSTSNLALLKVTVAFTQVIL